MRLFAYIDPGTGSIFLQAAIGGALAAVVVLRSVIRNAYHKVKLAFSRQEIADEEA